jgi:recombination protein RecR
VTVGAIDDLVTELARLPGIGRKTAQRLTFHLMQQPPERSARLADVLQAVAERVHPCPECGNLTEAAACDVCADPRRDEGVLCVVEEPFAIAAMDRAGFRGRYLVLGGHLSPLDGIGPESLRIGLLEEKVGAGTVREVVLATNPSLEGEATATYIHQLLGRRGVKISRLARGLPMGGDLDYVDGATLSHALQARQEIA